MGPASGVAAGGEGLPAGLEALHTRQPGVGIGRPEAVVIRYLGVGQDQEPVVLQRIPHVPGNLLGCQGPLGRQQVAQVPGLTVALWTRAPVQTGRVTLKEWQLSQDGR